MTGMLASVTNLLEARIVLKAGADIIDLKQPAKGALGALETKQVSDIRNNLGQNCRVSATIGDFPTQPKTVVDAVTKMAATGVDYVKLGFFPGGSWKKTIDALAATARTGTRLIAVFFGDTGIDHCWTKHLANAGFHGAMIDTMDKSKGSLTQVCSESTIRSFIGAAKSDRLLCGLAGSLKIHDIPVLLNLEPDYLGFRGALCLDDRRTGELDAIAVKTIRGLVPRSTNKRDFAMSISGPEQGASAPA